MNAIYNVKASPISRNNAEPLFSNSMVSTFREWNRSRDSYGVKVQIEYQGKETKDVLK